jgi:hypothetical protein
LSATVGQMSATTWGPCSASAWLDAHGVTIAPGATSAAECDPMVARASTLQGGSVESTYEVDGKCLQHVRNMSATCPQMSATCLQQLGPTALCDCGLMAAALPLLQGLTVLLSAIQWLLGQLHCMEGRRRALTWSVANVRNMSATKGQMSATIARTVWALASLLHPAVRGHSQCSRGKRPC